MLTFVASASGARVVTFHRSQLARVWDARSGACERTFRANRAPVVAAALDASGTLAAAASGDRALSLWDCDGGFATHALRGGHDGLVGALAFAPQSLIIPLS